MSDSEGKIEMVEEEEATRPALVPSLHTEVLAEAVSNDTEVLEPTGFAVKYAKVTVHKPTNLVMATSMEYLLKNKLDDNLLGVLLPSPGTLLQCLKMSKMGWHVLQPPILN